MLCCSDDVAIFSFIELTISLDFLIFSNEISTFLLLLTLYLACSCPLCIDVTASLANNCSRLTTFSIYCVEAAERCANMRTSSATTAKPRPCSPARAALIAAFNANRLVCSASYASDVILHRAYVVAFGVNP